MQKSYTLDLTNYTEDDILFVAQFYGYGEFSNPELTPLEHIEQQFKSMADNWFARPMIQRATQEIEAQKSQIVAGVYQQVSSDTSIE
jgi:hypothetical protein